MNFVDDAEYDWNRQPKAWKSWRFCQHFTLYGCYLFATLGNKSSTLLSSL
jgi:hypothetical protein